MPTYKFKGEYAHITLTTPKLKIFRPKINKAYFATAKIEAVTTTSTTKTVQETYVVAGGDTLSKIASKKGTTVAAIIESDAQLTQANKDNLRVGQKITLPNTVATTETNKKITFEKANEGALGSELYIVVETEGFQGYSVFVNIKQGKAKGIEEKDALVTFKDENGNYVTKAEIKVGALCESHYSNMDDYTDMAIYKLQIDHNDATKKEAWQKALEGKDKKTPLYLLVDGHTVPGQEEINVNYHGDSEGGEIRGEAIKNLWLDSDGNWFELINNKRAPWMEIALKEAKKAKGLKESKNPLYDMIEDKYHKYTGIIDNPKTKTVNEADPNSVAWCASFVSWCLGEANFDNPKSVGSRHYLEEYSKSKKTLKKIEKPYYGAVTVFSDCDSKGVTKTSGHVGFVYGKLKGGKIAVLGGNQGNKLKVSGYDCTGNVFVSWKEKNGTKHYKKFRGYYLPKEYEVSGSDKLKSSDNFISVKEANKKALKVELKTNTSGESSR